MNLWLPGGMVGEKNRLEFGTDMDTLLDLK